METDVTKPVNAITAFKDNYRFLSNFYLCPVSFGGIMYRSAEHAYQASKTDLTNDRDAIRLAATPGQAKRLGKTVALRPHWEDLKKVIMLEIVLSKFMRNGDLKAMLFLTGDAALIEGNTWHDNYWGDCYCGNAGTCSLPGYNALGRILESVRFV